MEFERPFETANINPKLTDNSFFFKKSRPVFIAQLIQFY